MPSIRQVIAAHRRYSLVTPFSSHFGDGFAYSRNETYRNIRDAALKLDYRIVNTDLEWFLKNPLAALESILTRKQIPYVPNSDAYIDIMNRLPCDYVVRHIPLTTINHVLHESAHCVADSVWTLIVGDHLSLNRFTAARKDGMAAVLGMVICESFAAACEYFGGLYAKTDVDRYIYDLLSYIGTRSNRQRLISKCVRILGEKRAFKLMLFAYIHSNFLCAKFRMSDLNKTLEIIDPDVVISDVKKNYLLQAFKEAETLSLQFRLVTSRFHFALVGVKGRLEKRLSFDFMKLIQANPKIILFIDVLADVAINGSESVSLQRHLRLNSQRTAQKEAA